MTVVYPHSIFKMTVCPTGRISFKLYGWNPAEFPRRLQHQYETDLISKYLSDNNIQPMDVYMYFRGSDKAAEMKREAAKRTMMAALQ